MKTQFINQSNKNVFSFSNINYGAIFKFKNNIYIRIYYIGEINAVSLLNGTAITVPEDSEVVVYKTLTASE